MRDKSRATMIRKMITRILYIFLLICLLFTSSLFSQDKEVGVSIFIDSKEISSFTKVTTHSSNPVGLTIDEQNQLIFFDMPTDKVFSGYLISADTITSSTAFSLIATVEQINSATNKYGINVTDIDAFKDDSIIIASNGEANQFNGIISISRGISPIIKVITEVKGLSAICVDRKSTPNIIYTVKGNEVFIISADTENGNLEKYFTLEHPISDIAIDDDGNQIILYAEGSLSIDKLSKNKAKSTFIDETKIKSVDESVIKNVAIAIDKSDNSIYLYSLRKIDEGKISGIYTKFDKTGSMILKLKDEQIRKADDFEGMKNRNELVISPAGKGMVIDAIGNLLVADGVTVGESKEEKNKHTFSIISISEISTSATPWSAYK